MAGWSKGRISGSLPLDIGSTPMPATTSPSLNVLGLQETFRSLSLGKRGCNLIAILRIGVTGSTADSDSVSKGSNPLSVAKRL